MNKFAFHSKIVGVTFVEGAQQLLSTLQPGSTLELVTEPDNMYDSNAVAVLVGDGRVGYLPKETAAKLNKDVEAGNVTCVISEITGGTTGKSNVGCNIVLEVTREDDR